MNESELINSVTSKLDQVREFFKDNLKTIRTGRANSSILDGVVVDAYGASMPLKQLASISVVDAQLIQVTPFDPSNIESINSAIRSNQSLALNPSDDGRVIRLSIPPLTEERRREVAKQINEKLEESLIRNRNTRHDGMNQVDQLKKDKIIGEDDARRIQKKIDELVNASKLDYEKLAKDKEVEVLSL